MAVRKPPYLLKLSATNFRSLRSVHVSLGPLNVLVGPNGAGKSNLLDVVRFLGDSVRNDIAGALRIRGGYRRVAYRGRPRASAVSIAIEAAVTTNSTKTAPDEYELSFTGVGVGRAQKASDWYAVQRTEKFKFKRTNGPGRRISLEGEDLQVFADDTLELDLDFNSTSLALATLPKLGAQAGGREVEALADLFESFRVFDIDVNLARQPVHDSDSMHLEDDASNLATFLQFLERDHSAVFRDLLDDAKTFIPGLKSIEFRAVGGSAKGTYVALIEDSLKDETPLADASFGSVRALALLAVLYDPNPPKLTCIEEIDHGLHPYVLDRLVELMRRASQKTQIIIATHSPSLVNRLSADELIVVEKDEDGASIVPAIDAATVREMEKAADGELGLGELWFSGLLGGVPD